MEEARKIGRRRAARFVRLLLALLALAPSSGCWDQDEVSNVGFILAAGMDAEKDDAVRLTIQVFVPNPTAGGGGDGGEGRVITFTGSGPSVPEALGFIQNRVPRALSWDHAKMIIIGEALASRGIKDEFDFLFRDIEPREQANFFVTRGHAREMLQSLNDPNSYDTIIRVSNMPQVSTYNMNYIEELMTGEARAFVLPEAETMTLLVSATPKQALTVKGMAVIKNGKLAGWIGEKDAQGMQLGFQWLHPRKQGKNFAITIKEAGGKITAELVGRKLRYVPRIENGEWKMTVRLRLDADIVQNSSSIDLFDTPGALRALEPKFDDAIKELLRRPLNEVQGGLNADVLGFARAFHKKYPREWKQASGLWDEKFREVDVTLEVKCRLRKAGIANLRT
ncbi:Ger(x)C family spore germination protein [Cohnella sp. GCM10027633]|uniref:Ger(x)C family spore germination protein n=1 Tax=unclassified Cohnella TaxID=2636738 RepID=UPI00362B7D03